MARLVLIGVAVTFSVMLRPFLLAAQFSDVATELRLVGVSYLDPKAPTAVIENIKSGTQDVFQVGDDVFNAGKLVAVSKTSATIIGTDGVKKFLSQTGGAAGVAAVVSQNSKALARGSQRGAKGTRSLQELAAVVVPPQVLEKFSANLSSEKLQELVGSYQDSPVALGRDKDDSLYFDPSDQAELFKPARLFGSPESFQVVDSGSALTSGLMIKNVETSTVISPLGLQPGDTIVKVARIPIRSYDDFKKALSNTNGITVGIEYLSGGNRRGKEIRFLKAK